MLGPEVNEHYSPTWFRIIFPVVICVVLLGCGGEDSIGKAAPRKLQGAVLILLDTVRADHLSCYGYTRPTSPNLDALAREGVIFKQVVSYSPWTIPSVATLLAGEYPERVFNMHLLRSLVERFQQMNISTAAFTEGGYVSRSFGFDRGFRFYKEEEGIVQLLKPGKSRNPNARGGIKNTFALAKQWLLQHKDENFFLFIHTYEPHTPYTNHDFTVGMDSGTVGPVFNTEVMKSLRSRQMVLNDNEVEYVKALYDGDILNSDRYVGDFLSFLDNLRLRDRTLIVVTSDHGEELNDQYPAYTGSHGHSLCDPLLLVPLIIYDPLHLYAVHEVLAQVRLIDIMPTIADLLGVSIERPIDGISLLPFMDGTEKEDRIALMGQTRLGPLRFGIRSLGFKYIVTVGLGNSQSKLIPAPPPRQLYDLSTDPDERQNLVEKKPKLAEQIHQLLQDQSNNLTRRIKAEISYENDSALLERLKSLGYIK
jgi:arylsulfatase A-like enzyme